MQESEGIWGQVKEENCVLWDFCLSELCHFHINCIQEVVRGVLCPQLSCLSLIKHYNTISMNLLHEISSHKKWLHFGGRTWFISNLYSVSWKLLIANVCFWQESMNGVSWVGLDCLSPVQLPFSGPSIYVNVYFVLSFANICTEVTCHC